MRVLFGALHFGNFRNYESVVVALAERGHDVVLTADDREVLDGRRLVERLTAQYPTISTRFTPPLDAWPWLSLATGVRRGLEYLRFSDPAYDAQPKYRHRARPRAPRIAHRWAEQADADPRVRPRIAARLKAVERGIPPPDALVAFQREIAPDVVLLAAVTNDGAPQMDHLKTALHLRIPVAMPVYSWDHLSGKAVVHIAPDRLLVWNETQRHEAIALHGIDAARIVTTGAQAYDQWFERTPSRTRETFLGELGLDPARPLVLYVCSVLSRPAPRESAFVLEWIDRLRESTDPVLREANVLIRPHPERLDEWSGVDLSGRARVALRGRNPIDPDAKADYFDALFHADAVVGIITSAFLEAAVAGRPSLTIEEPRFREHQEGAPHYHYLRDADTGLLLVARTFEAHLAQLSGVLAGDAAAEARTAAFVRNFVRPLGPGVVATERFVQAIESTAALRPPAPAIGGALDTAAAWSARALLAVPRYRRLWWSEEEAQRHGRPAEERREKQRLEQQRQERRAATEAERASRVREKEEKRARKAAAVEARDQVRLAAEQRKRRRVARAQARARLKQQLLAARRVVRQAVAHSRRALRRARATLGTRLRGRN